MGHPASLAGAPSVIKSETDIRMIHSEHEMSSAQVTTSQFVVAHRAYSAAEW